MSTRAVPGINESVSLFYFVFPGSFQSFFPPSVLFSHNRCHCFTQKTLLHTKVDAVKHYTFLFLKKCPILHTIFRFTQAFQRM